MAPDGTGKTIVDPPSSWDVAFRVDVPGLAGAYTAPVVVEGGAFVLTDFRVDPESLESVDPMLWRIDLATANVTKWREFPAPDRFATGLSTDGTNLFVARMTHVEAISAWTGEVAWSAPFPTLPGQVSFGSGCASPIFHEGIMFWGCTLSQGPPALDNPLVGPTLALPEMDVVMAIDPSDGRIAWSRFRDAEAMTGETGARGTPTPTPGRNSLSIGTGIHELQVSGDLLTLAIVDRSPQAPLAQCSNAAVTIGSSPYFQTVWALDAGSGEHRWQFGLPGPSQPNADPDGPGTFAAQAEEYQRVAPGVLLADDKVYVKGDDLFVLAPGSGCVERVIRVGRGPESPLTMNLLAATPDVLLVARHTSVFALHRSSFEVVWEHEFRDAVIRAEQRALVVGDELILLTQTAEVNAAPDPSQLSALLNGRMEVLSVEDGSLRWSLEVRPFTHTGYMRALGISDGLILVDGSDGPVFGLGHAPASIAVRPAVSTSSPSLGELFRLDLKDSMPGAQAALVEFKVDWGDENVSDWGEAAIREHAYDQKGLRNVTVFARNDAGQTATATLRIDVGGTTKRGVFATAFAPENQERTYFLLGLAVTFLTAIGGLIFPLNKAKARIFGGSGEPRVPPKRRLQKRK